MMVHINNLVFEVDKTCKAVNRQNRLTYVPIIYLPKTQKKGLSDVFKGYKMGILAKIG